MTRRAADRCRELLRDDLDRDAARELLSRVGFRDWESAHASIRRLAGEARLRPALGRLLPHLLTTLGGAAGPDGVLVNLERFVSGAPDGAKLLSYLAENPRAIEILVTLFSGSQFLTEILLRNPEWFARVAEPRKLAVPKSAEELTDEARAEMVPHRTHAARLDALRRFQRLELLRIGTCDLLDLFDLPTVTSQLSGLADALVRAALQLAAAESHTAVDGFAVIGMGKLGGEELNYSSDIDLLFVARSDGTVFWPVGEKVIEALSAATGEGFLYRVDMRLRPWGESGALVSSVDGYLAYLERDARLWEKQALLKARVVAGDEAVGADLLRRAEPVLYGLHGASAQAARGQVRAMRERTETMLRRQGLDGREVKLGEGSIRDIEFVAQYLQLAHGGEQPAIRSRSTLDALARLLAHGFLSAEEHRVLSDGYVFLRTIEHHLQVMHYRQTHTLPEDADALAELARRLGFAGADAGERFRARHQEHAAAIRAVYLRHLGGQKAEAGPASPSASPVVRAHIARMDASYTATFAPNEIAAHAQLAEKLDDARLVEVEAAPLPDGLWRVTVVGYDYPGELSAICGLLFAYGFSIEDGSAFTYEPAEASPPTEAAASRSRPSRAFRAGWVPRKGPAPGAAGSRRKIVDVFKVRPVREGASEELWARYAEDLRAMLRLMHQGKHREARGEVAKRAAATLLESAAVATTLYPVEIEIDNEASERYTVLRIESRDTLGFLYELTNALALGGIYIARVTCESVGSGLHDVLYVCDAGGKKITAPERQRELRAATVLIKHFTHLLPRSPNPESALLHFGELVSQLLRRADWADELASLERPKVLDAVAQLLGVSDFLWDDFLRMQHANLFPLVRDVDGLATAKTKERLEAELEAVLAGERTGAKPEKGSEGWRAALNAFKDRELFRVDMRHILGDKSEFERFSEELTDLVEVVVEATYRMCDDELRVTFGSPVLEDGTKCPLSICGLGKCGGRELGFASDVELIFIYGGDGRTEGVRSIGLAEYFEKLAQSFLGAVRAKHEGVFEIDLQLRPYGKAGSMAVSLDAFRRYFAPRGPAWAYERQSLVRLRPIAGDAELGRRISAMRDLFAYTGEAFDVTAMRAMRERQIRHLVTGGTFNAKFSPGGLAEIEYLVQALQITHGFCNPSVRVTNTRQAMAALEGAGFLDSADHVQLRRAHTFLRWLIDALRVVRGNAKDVTVPPFGSEEFAFLARRLRYEGDVSRLRDELARYTASVQELNARLLG